MDNANNDGCKTNIKSIDNIKILSDEQLDHFNELKRAATAISETISPLVTTMDELIPYLTTRLSEAIKPFADFSLRIAPMINAINEVGKTLAPMFAYLHENADKIENFYNSFEKLEDYYVTFKGMTSDEAINKIDDLIEEGKIIIKNDWSFEIMDETDDKIIDKSKSKVLLNNIINTIGIIISLFSGTGGIDVNVENSSTYIDNSVNNTEIHYHITNIDHLNNKRIISSNNVNLYTVSSSDSDVLVQLNRGDLVNKAIEEDGWILVTILGDDNNIEYTGWIKSDNVID